MDFWTMSGAARRLQISMAELQILLADNTVQGEQLPDGRWLVSADSVRVFQRRTAEQGRPWSTITAWAALIELDNRSSPHISPATAIRVRERLHTITPLSLSRKVVGRSVVLRFTGRSSDELRGRLILTGPSAVAHKTQYRAERPETLHAYLRYPSDTIDEITAAHQLSMDVQGNIFLYDRPRWVTLELVGPAVLAADLSNSSTTAEINGLTALAALHATWVKTHPETTRHRSNSHW